MATLCNAYLKQISEKDYPLYNNMDYCFSFTVVLYDRLSQYNGTHYYVQHSNEKYIKKMRHTVKSGWLTNWGLVTPNGDRELGQYWLR